MRKIYGGLDIGGTKCVVLLGEEDADKNIKIIKRISFPTPSTPKAAIKKMFLELERLVSQQDNVELLSVGVSCGGPLDSKNGIILSPPNLPNWDHIDIVTPLEEKFDVPAAIQNDANACALAEWQWGAGAGYDNVVFLTFGTGMGAGLILNGKLYSGTNDMAGEVGHIRLEDEGPVGFGKPGSFEGFCSGGGIARQAVKAVKGHWQDGKETSICSSANELKNVSAKTVAEAAVQGDILAKQIYSDVGNKLGYGIAILLDVLNPEVVIIGSIYTRQEELLKSSMLEVLENEALSHTYDAASVVPSALGDAVGDYASISVARHALEQNKT